MTKVIAFRQTNGESGLNRPMYSARRQVEEGGSRRPETDDEVIARCMAHLPAGASNVVVVEEFQLPDPFHHFWNGTAWQVTAPAQARQVQAAAFGYRKSRAEAYRGRLGKRPENTHEETIGDVLDALLKDAEQRRAGGATLHAELDAIVNEWQAIKVEIPKPPDPPAE